MVSIEVLVVEDMETAHQAESADLIDLSDDNQCENCDTVIAFAMGRFYPLVVCIDEEDDSWLICMECAGAVVYPGE